VTTPAARVILVSCVFVLVQWYIRHRTLLRREDGKNIHDDNYVLISYLLTAVYFNVQVSVNRSKIFKKLVIFICKSYCVWL